MTVIPDFQRTKLQGPRSNFSLYFSRMTGWVFERDNIKSRDGEIVTLGEIGNRLLNNAAAGLGAVHRRQHRLVEQAKTNGQFAMEIRARLKTPFVSGLGSGHPTETGMILDRNTGVPYIPASSIKGVLRLAHAVNLLNGLEPDSQWIRKGKVNKHGEFNKSLDGDQFDLDDREPSLRRYFGDVITKDGIRGQLVFLDAYPEHVPTLKPDIMNPHYQRYYGASTREDIERGPVDCDDPIPVKFLSVSEGTVFIFRVLASSLVQPDKEEPDQVLRTFGPDDESAVQAMFFTAFDELGFGGKTSIGYGRFSVCAQEDVPVSSIQKEIIVWDNAAIKFSPGDQILTASEDGKKATAKGKELVPEQYHKKLFKDKKAIRAKVTVRAEGNMFQILKIE